MMQSAKARHPHERAPATRCQYFPRDPGELSAIKGFPRGLAKGEGKELIRRLRRVSKLPEDELEGYPRPRVRGPGRPPPEIEALADRLKVARNERADALGLDRGTLLSNAVITAIAWAGPRSLQDLFAVDGMRRWQAEAVGDDLLAVLNKTP